MITSESIYTILLPHVGHMDVRTGCTVLHSHCGVDILWDALDMNNFYFLFLLFFNFIGDFLFLFLFFSFGQWRGTWHCSHMTCHIMWCHRPRRWWKDLEDDVRAHVYNMVTLRRTWGCSMDNRAGLIIGSMDQACFV